MALFDVFNGDADGICALHQLRLAEPAEATLVTGPKREIDLMRRVEAGPGDRITVCDISLESNAADLARVLEAGAEVRWFDHHRAGEIPQHPHLAAHIDLAPDTCTSLIVDQHLGGRFRAWAVAAAFGDNFEESALRAAAPLSLSEERLGLLRELGNYLNYNGYGPTLEDLFFHPQELYLRVRPYADPFAFIAEEEAFRVLREGYLSDMSKADAARPEFATDGCALYFLPDADWARRVSGVFANRLAQDSPKRAHALLTPLPAGGFRVSVRAPVATRRGADELCRQFPTGGGRSAAAGINALPADQYDLFVERLRAAYP